MRSSGSHPIVSIGAISVATLVANAGAPTHSWLTPVDGNWSDSVLWDVGTVPGLLDHAQLGLSGAYTVTLPTTGNAMELSITNPDAVFQINNAQTMNLFGDLSNEGLIVINSTASGNATQLDFEADAMLTGTGTILLNSTGSRSQIRTGVGMTFTQGIQHTIEGYGQITGSMVNNGTIDANVATLAIALNSNDKANNTIMRASNGGNLQITSISVNQGSNGTIAADGPGSVVDFSNATLINGNVQSTNDGLIRISNSTFDGVDFLQGEMHLLNAMTLDVFNSLTNDGVIIINPNSSGNSTQLDFESSGSFLGSGEVILNSIGSRARLRTGADVTMTNSATHTIRGFGQIESDFINDGVVNANVDAQELTMNFNPKLNNAMMMATNGGILDFTSISVAQSVGAEILAEGAGSRIDFNSTTITGGEINATDGATVEIMSATYDGVSVAGPHNLANAATLDVFNSIVNNGVITVNPLSLGNATQLDFEKSGSFLGNGEVVLNSLGARARLRTAPGATMTNSASHTIRGWGQIEAALINEGLVSADKPGESIVMNFDDKVNNSTIRAIDTGTIELVGITLDQDMGGQVFADGVDSTIEIRNTTIIGGDLAALNGATIETFGATLDAVNFGQGVMNQTNASNISIFNSLTNNGEIVVNPLSGGSATTFDFQNTGALNGMGILSLNSFDARAWVRTLNDARLTNTANHTIRGYGRMAADLINNGLISADVMDNTIFFNAEPIENNNFIEAINGAEADFTGISIDQAGGGVIRAIGNGSTIDFTSSTVLSGLISTTNGAAINAFNSTFDGVEIQGIFNSPNAGNNFIRGGVINNGTMTINAAAGGSQTQLQWLDESTLGGTGTVRLNSFDARSWLTAANGVTMGTMGPGQRLEGIGRIGLSLELQGTHAPGLSVGTMFGTNPLTYTDSTTLEIEVDAVGADLYDSSSTVALDGTLDVTFVDGFSPPGFWARTIIEGSTITGKFDTVNIPAPASGLVTKVINTGSAVLIGHTCPGDNNLDGLVNFFDVSIFLSDFSNQRPAADLNNDGQWNFFDVSLFLANFSAGC